MRSRSPQRVGHLWADARKAWLHKPAEFCHPYNRLSSKEIASDFDLQSPNTAGEGWL
jgi:hypothetical protein